MKRACDKWQISTGCETGAVLGWRLTKNSLHKLKAIVSRNWFKHENNKLQTKERHKRPLTESRGLKEAPKPLGIGGKRRKSNFLQILHVLLFLSYRLTFLGYSMPPFQRPSLLRSHRVPRPADERPSHRTSIFFLPYSTTVCQNGNTKKGEAKKSQGERCP